MIMVLVKGFIKDEKNVIAFLAMSCNCTRFVSCHVSGCTGGGVVTGIGNGINCHHRI